MANLKNHPGFWLRDDAAKAYDAMEAKYGKQTLNSAGRTEGEQQNLINRWDQGGPSNRPPYLYQPARPANTSPHVANGGIAVDMAAGKSIQDKMAEFGFVWFGPSDPVHYNFRGWNGSTPNTPNARGGYQDGSAELRRFQQKLITMGHDLGPTGADAIYGPRTKAATEHEQEWSAKNGYAGVAVDGIPGPQTEAYLDWWLAKKNPRPDRPSPKNSSQLTYADIQSALVRKGYNIAVDNVWGPKSSNALADFQGKNGLKVDRLVGPATWDKLNTW